MQEEGPPGEARNIVICCDGTSNEIGVQTTNVLKLYRIAAKSKSQHVYYHPGVGTIGQLAAWGRISQKADEVFGLATGYGLDDNILDAYRYLCTTYRDGDKIFLFGFSRGAYTVRALAGLINMIGLLWPDQVNIADYALTAYKKAMEEHDLPIAWEFGRMSAARDVSIHFMGVWDTVASVIVPRPDRYYWPSLEYLPYTGQNERVRVFRQACAIDERRAMFRLYGWKPGQAFKQSRFSTDTVPQDQQQVWFAGVHADVGGGYPEAESGLAKFPLLWMVKEAAANGLLLNHTLLAHLADGQADPHGRYTYAAPDAGAMLHRSLKGLWWLDEIVPKRAKWLRWPGKRQLLGLYLPLAEPRFIPDGSLVHQSAVDRMRLVPGYKPINIPAHYTVV